MIKRLSTYFSIILLVLACKKSATDQVNSIVITDTPIEKSIDHSKAIRFIEGFYQNNYGTDDLDSSNFTQFLSQRVKDRMEEFSDVDNLILNYDPFIQAQDFDATMISYTLKVDQASGKEDEYNVSFKLFEGQTEPPTNIIIQLVEKDGSFLIDGVKNDQYLSFEDIKIIEDEIIEKTSDRNVLSDIDPAFYGAYHLTQDKGKIDEFSSIVIGYSIEVKKDSVFFSGQGYQTNFYDLCIATQNKDTLNIYYSSSIEGTEYNKSKSPPLVKLYRVNNNYFAKSPAIWVDAKPNVEVLFEKEE